MLKRVKLILKEDIVVSHLDHKISKTALYIFLIVVLILSVFKPSSLSKIKTLPLFILTFGYGIIAVIGYLINMLFFKFHKKLRRSRFQDLKNYTFAFLLIWLCIYLYTLFCIKVIFSKWIHVQNLPSIIPNYLLIKTFIYTFGIGYLVYFILHFYDLQYCYNLKSKYNLALEELNEKYFNQKNISFFTLKGKGKNEFISIEKNLFLCAISQGHYLKIIFIQKNKLQYNLKNMIIRNSLKELERQNSSIKSIFRCHNSYIINTDYIKSTQRSGNKISYIRISFFSEKIPISKNKIDSLEKILIQNQSNTTV